MGRPGLLENGVGTMLDVNLRQMCPQFLLQRFLERGVLYFQARRGGLLLKLVFVWLKMNTRKTFWATLSYEPWPVDMEHMEYSKKYHDAAGFWPSTKVPIWTGHSWDIVIHITVFSCIHDDVLRQNWWIWLIFSKHPSASLALTKSWCTPAIHHSPALALTAEQRPRAQWFLSAFRIYEVCGRTRGIRYADIKSSCSESEGISPHQWGFQIPLPSSTSTVSGRTSSFVLNWKHHP